MGRNQKPLAALGFKPTFLAIPGNNCEFCKHRYKTCGVTTTTSEIQSGTVSNTTPTLLIDALQRSKHGSVNWFSGTDSWPCGYSKKPVMVVLRQSCYTPFVHSHHTRILHKGLPLNYPCLFLESSRGTQPCCITVAI